MGDLHKLYYRIGEVSKIVGVEPHVLRYWEQSLRSVRPTKSPKGHRIYTKKDVEKLLRVRDLLYEQKFTLAGARQKLRERGLAEPDEASADALPDAGAEPEAAASPRVAEALRAVREEVVSLLSTLDWVEADILRSDLSLQPRARAPDTSGPAARPPAEAADVRRAGAATGGAPPGAPPRDAGGAPPGAQPRDAGGAPPGVQPRNAERRLGAEPRKLE